MAAGDVVWLGRDKCALRLLEIPRDPEIPYAPSYAPPQRDGTLGLAPSRRGSLRADGGSPAHLAASGGGVHRRSTADGLPTGGAADAPPAAAPFRLAGTLLKKSQRSGLYLKREVVVEGTTLRYHKYVTASLLSETPDVLSGGNIERLEVRPPTGPPTPTSHSLTLSLAHSLTHSCTHALMHSRSHARTLARSHARTLTRSHLSHPLTRSGPSRSVGVCSAHQEAQRRVRPHLHLPRRDARRV